MAQGSGKFGKICIVHLACGAVVMLVRLLVEHGNGRLGLLQGEKSKSHETHVEQRPLRQFLNTPFVPFTLFLLLGSVFLPQQPWKHMTATLLYDVVGTISATIISKTVRDMRTECNSVRGGSTLGNFNYNPVDDPYYISNLDSPVDPFIAEALKGTQFTNIVHIVLESMRADSYPWQETGDLARHILENFERPLGSPEITTEQVTPFIQSIAENVISWETVWATIPFTHKAMLGRTSLFDNGI